MMDSRTTFVVVGMVVLYVCAWLFSLQNLLNIHFWDPVYALNKIKEITPDEAMNNSTTFSTLAASYYRKERYVAFLPHIIAAILWWNLYFIQLIKPIRRGFPTFHRNLGRLLMCVAVCQTVSGTGLAFTSSSPTIKIVSIFTALSTFYCIVRAWYYAANKDFIRHKYWAKRLVGYMQTIALQRFWVVTLIISHQSGVHFLYPSFEGKSLEETNRLVSQMFDDSFVMAIITALLVTEWYLAAQEGMMDDPEPIKNKLEQNGTEAERVPLYSTTL